jgi:hypothetical protein
MWKRPTPLLLVVGLVACGGDEAPAPDLQIEDTGGGALCDSIPRATDIGAPCGAGSPCGAGALCIDTGDGSTCAQVCFPDECGDTCGNARTCAQVETAQGAYTQDVDGDGDAEVIGACVAPRPGDRQAYETCGAAGSCAAGLLCAGVAGRIDGTCFPVCDAACDAWGGFASVCAPTNGESNICVVTCDPGLGVDACPAGLACATLAQGTAVCVN